MESELLNNIDILIQINEGFISGFGEFGLKEGGAAIGNALKNFLHFGGGVKSAVTSGIHADPAFAKVLVAGKNRVAEAKALADAAKNPVVQSGAKQVNAAVDAAAKQVTAKSSSILKRTLKVGTVGGGGLIAADHLLPNQTQTQTNTPASTQAATVSKPIINSPAAKVAEVQHAKLLNQNPWKLDSKGNVLGTHLTPQQYNQHLEQKFGADKADGAIRKAMGPGWGDGSNYHRK